MRWIIYFLLILNGVVLSWFQFHNYYYPQTDEGYTQVKAFNFSSVPSLELIDSKDFLVDESHLSAAEKLPSSSEDSCWIVGSFPEVISAREVRIELEDQGVYSHIIEKEMELPIVSWVYIPAFDSREEAMPVLRSLQVKGIDSFLMTDEDEYQFAISLGFFGNKDSAEKIRAERRAEGYDAQIVERVRKRLAYWLSVYDIQHSASEIMHKKLDKVLQQQKNLKKSEISCKELALFKAKH